MFKFYAYSMYTVHIATTIRWHTMYIRLKKRFSYTHLMLELVRPTQQWPITMSVATFLSFYMFGYVTIQFADYSVLCWQMNPRKDKRGKMLNRKKIWFVVVGWLCLSLSVWSEHLISNKNDFTDQTKKKIIFSNVLNNIHWCGTNSDEPNKKKAN